MADTVTPDRLRSFANLPAEAPEALLSIHIDAARRDLERATGLTDAPAGLSETWDEAVILKALCGAYPWLHTFALSGAAKVGRLEGSVEFRFLDVEDVDARVAALDARYALLVADLRPVDGDGADGDTAEAGGFWMGAI